MSESNDTKNPGIYIAHLLKPRCVGTVMNMGHGQDFHVHVEEWFDEATEEKRQSIVKDMRKWIIAHHEATK